MEEKAKQPVLKKVKQVANDISLNKRANPYSKENGSDEFFYLPSKKSHLNPEEEINAGTDDMPESSKTDLSTLMGRDTDEPDMLRVISAIKISSILNCIRAKKGELIQDNEGDLLRIEDYQILETLFANEYLLLAAAPVWFSLEIGNVSFYTQNNDRYFTILGQILKTLENPELLMRVTESEGLAVLFLEFFKKIPMIDDMVFYSLRAIMETI